MEQRETSSRNMLKVRKKTAEPSMSEVWIINDDITEINFVIQVLYEVFFKSSGEASRIAWDTHRKGKALIGDYPYDIALSKVDKATASARAKGYPLRFDVVPKKE